MVIKPGKSLNNPVGTILSWILLVGPTVHLHPGLSAPVSFVSIQILYITHYRFTLSSNKLLFLQESEKDQISVLTDYLILPESILTIIALMPIITIS